MEVVFLTFILVLSIFLGFELIAKVPATLHTPLMSGANAISGITIVGALLAVKIGAGQISVILAVAAVATATINVVGGYMVTDRSLRIRSGVFHIREMTMTFMNIQQLSVHQGPLQRLLGLYDLRVRTAGGGDSAEGAPHQESGTAVTHIGHLRGVDNAPAIRDLILERMRKARDAGLGDSDDVTGSPLSETSAGMEQFRAAVAGLQSETHSLREAVVRVG